MNGGQPPAFVEDEWQRAVSVFREQIASVNKRIFDYNLDVPLARFQRRPVDAEVEMLLVNRSDPAGPVGAKD